LKQCAIILENQMDIKNKLKAFQNELNIKLEKKYPKLDEEEIKNLVINEKWLKHLSVDIKDELNNILQNFAERIKELAERYKTPLPKLTTNVEKLSTIVDEHLKKMGKLWK
jgi:type I restriction enzyme M protein